MKSTHIKSIVASFQITEFNHDYFYFILRIARRSLLAEMLFTSTAEAGKVVWAVEDSVAELLEFVALEDGAAAFGAEFGESE